LRRTVRRGAGNGRARNFRPQAARRAAGSCHRRHQDARHRAGKDAGRLMEKTILLATRSQGKLKEMAAIFADLAVEVTDLRSLGIDELPEEDSLEEFPTFEENALAKARYFFKRSGVP